MRHKIPTLLLHFQVHRVQGIYIFQFNAPLYFASAGVYIETGVNPGEQGMRKGPRGCFQQCGDHVYYDITIA